MAKRCVLLVSNDREAGGIWAYALRQKDLGVTLVASAAEAWARWAQEPCELILIDVCGSDLDGVELARRLRAETVNPILLFTLHREEAHLLEAYQAGVDECIVKPVSPSLVLAKVHVWLRRCWCVTPRTRVDLKRGALRLDAARQELSIDEAAPIRLSNLEFQVLYLLMGHQGQVLPTDLIVERVWGLTGEGNSALLKNVIYRLRRKIEPDPGQARYLQTVGRQGYVFYST
jgi:DNA-binding response OmpR family regulator